MSGCGVSMTCARKEHHTQGGHEGKDAVVKSSITAFICTLHCQAMVIKM